MPKIINTSHTTNTVGLPFLARSVNWLQEKTDEQDIAMIQSLNQNTNTSEVWQLYFKNIRNTSGTTWVWDNGAVLYNAKIYNSDGGTVTLGGGESLVYYFITTAQAEEPTIYTDGTSFQTNENIKIGICKNTENVAQQIQAVNLFRVINLEKTETTSNDDVFPFKLIKRGNLYTLTVFSIAGVSNVPFLILKNYAGSNNSNGFVTKFGFYDSRTSKFEEGYLIKTGDDLFCKVRSDDARSINFTVSWVQ